LAIPFMIGVTAADIAFRLPVNINVPLPAALIFYPVIGYVAQIALHIVPFTIILFLLRSFLPAGDPSRHMWAGILLASVPEAIFQTVFTVNGQDPLGIAAYVAVSLFLFGVVELNLLRRFDFATMYAFRFIYYCYWHLTWGNVRLHWLS
ncbi:MAG: hypothetical protein OEQ39_20190, partial [Gammaproteobacteria bacterium]|nr:hypothetical protein [Gammaproteobacteria bacterium]